MLTLLSEIKFLNTRNEDILIKDTDYGSFRPSGSSKKEYLSSSSSSSSDYGKCFWDAKQDYESRRNISSASSHIKAKLKSALKHLEDELKSKKVIYCEFMNENIFQLMLHDGLLITVEISTSGDIQKLNFDKYFIGKLVSEHVCDVIINRSHVIISYNENIITFVYLQKPAMHKTFQKISAADPKIFNVVVATNNTIKIRRNISMNPNNDVMILWAKNSQNEFFPWRPSKDQDRANLHIYALNRDKIELISYYWTENSPIQIEFSKFNENEVKSIEQKISRKGEVIIECIKYYLNVNKGKFQRLAVTSIPLDTEVACCCFSPDHQKILMSCIDGSIVLFDDHLSTTYLVRCSFIPSSITFHPDSALIVVANERAQLQAFDIALSCVKNQLLSEDTTPSNILDLSTFVKQNKIHRVAWSKKPDINHHQRGSYARTDCHLLLIFENAIANIKFIGGAGLRRDIHTSGLSPDVFIHLYTSLNQIEKAINVLLSLNWDTYGAMCLLSLHKISNYLFRIPSKESEELLEKALGSFYKPIKPLCAETENEFGENVDDIARRFFHFLIRNKSFEKAFRLAIDLNDFDIFMLLQKCAKVCKNYDLMNEAKRRADEIYRKQEEEECNSHHSSCSMTSCSICSGSEESYDSTKSVSDDDIPAKKNYPLSSSSSKNLSCPPLPKLPDSFSAPPLPAHNDTMKLTSQNLKKFNSNSTVETLNTTMQRSLVLNENEFSMTDSCEPGPSNSTMTKIHNYPLISGSIPSNIGGCSNQAYLNVTPSTAIKREQMYPVNSILKKEGGGEKNKVKFSDTIQVAVVPEISRKEKMNNFNDKTKRKSFSSPDFLVDLVKRELKESLPLCHPNKEYLLDFLPAQEKAQSKSNDDKKEKPSIKVVNFGIL